MEPPRLQSLTSRTTVDVLHWIIRKCALRKNALASHVILLGRSIAHVTGRPALSAGHVVLLRPVLIISYCYFYFAASVLLMLARLSRATSCSQECFRELSLLR